MKAHKIWGSQLDPSKPEFWLPTPPSENSTIQDLIFYWKQFHTPESDFSRYKPIKELTEAWSLNTQIYWTHKQYNLTNNCGANGIFLFIKKIHWRRLAFFSWKYFQGALVFPHTKPCECNSSQANSTHEHLLFHCPIGDDAWTSAHHLIEIFEANQTAKTRISSELDLWSSINNPTTRPQVKIIILCAVMARWLNRWKPPHTSSTILWKDFLNNAASAELDKALQTMDEESRNVKLQKIKNKWLFPRLFRIKFSNLFLRDGF